MTANLLEPEFPVASTLSEGLDVSPFAVLDFRRLGSNLVVDQKSFFVLVSLFIVKKGEECDTLLYLTLKGTDHVMNWVMCDWIIRPKPLLFAIYRDNFRNA